MRSSKGRTIEKKRVNKANKIARTERSRKHRIANKHKREEIHAIDPDMKVVVINQKTFDKHGTEIEVMDGKIRAVTPTEYDDTIVEYQEIMDKEHPVIEKIKTENRSALERLTDKLKGKISLWIIRAHF